MCNCFSATSHSQVRRVHCYEESYSVRELRFGLWSPREHHDGLEALSLAAPDIRIMEVMADNILNEFLACQNGMYPVDHWEPLERFTITIGEVHELDDMRKYIVPSLKQRRNLGKPIATDQSVFGSSWRRKKLKLRKSS